MQAYLQALFRSEPGVNDALAERLAIRANRAINRMLVWDATPPAPANDEKAPEPEAKDEGQPEPAPAQAADEPAFDPFAFSAMVVLVKKGPAGLMTKLEEISELENLKTLANAQHIGLKGPVDTVEDVRAAILEGTKQRLADRRAAAS